MQALIRRLSLILVAAILLAQITGAARVFDRVGCPDPCKDTKPRLHLAQCDAQCGVCHVIALTEAIRVAIAYSGDDRSYGITTAPSAPSRHIHLIWRPPIASVHAIEFLHPFTPKVLS